MTGATPGPDHRDGVRVLHAVAYVSIDSAYGGPVTVACNQSAALSTAGVPVTLVAGWDGAARRPRPCALLFRAKKLVRRSFASLFAPGLLWWAARHIGAYDVVHIHFARDLIMIPLAVLALVTRRAVVLQPHGMVQRDQRGVVDVIDRLVTGPLLRRAAVVVALTERESEALLQFGVHPERIRVIGNGVGRADIVARYVDTAPRVLFASRLAPRKRPVAFVHMAGLLREWRPDVTFELWGPDGGMLDEVTREIDRLGMSGVCRYRGALENRDMRRVMAETQIFVLPSFEEPFPMALLEAMSAGVPSIITHDTGVSARAAQVGASVITDGSPEQMAAAVRELLSDPPSWNRSAEASRALVASTFSMEAVVESLTAAYTKALTSRRSRWRLFRRDRYARRAGV